MPMLNVVAGAVLLMAALDRLNRMTKDTRFIVRLAGWLLALAGGAAVLWPIASSYLQQALPLVASSGAALWLLVDRRVMT